MKCREVRAANTKLRNLGLTCRYDVEAVRLADSRVSPSSPIRAAACELHHFKSPCWTGTSGGGSVVRQLNMARATSPLRRIVQPNVIALSTVREWMNS